MENNIRQFESWITNIPEETNRSYENQMTRIAKKCSSPEWEERLLQLIQSNHPNAYEAFFVLCTVHRRNKDFQKLGSLLEDCVCFRNHPSYSHLVVMYHVHSESFYDYDTLLDMAYRDAEAFPSNAGYLHTFANSFATICESCNDEDRKRLLLRWYTHARNAIDAALALEPHYAKFHCTKGRIIAANEDYAGAMSCIRQAISLEDSSRPDYALTISNYQYFRLLVAANLKNSKLTQRLRYLEERLDSLYPDSKNMSVEAPPDVYIGTGSYAFISYAHLDSAEVFGVIDKLNTFSKNVWFDAGICPGEEWSEVLGKKIEECSVFILMLSNNSINSLNVRKEFNLALSLNKPVIGICLEDVVLSPGMRLQLELTQMINKYALAPETFEAKLQQISL